MGLVFLHNRTPAVIHRDLTARNVLLDSTMTAKIADLGNSRIANLRPDQLAQTMTDGVPGTAVYMPPEASAQHYGPRLDIFSFCHLALFTALQLFPQDLLPPTYKDPHTNEVKARTEIERRENYIKTLDGKIGEEHPLVVFIKECLTYEPERRPTARKALETLGDIKAAEEDPYQHMNRLQLEKILTEKFAQVELQATEITATGERIKCLQTQLQEQEAEKTELEGACRHKEELLAARELELERTSFLMRELDKLKAEKIILEEKCVAKDNTDSVQERLALRAMQAMLKIQRELMSLSEKYDTLETDTTEEIMMLTAAKNKVIKTARIEIAAKDMQLIARYKELSEKDDQLVSLQEEYATLQTQLDKAQRRIQTLEAGETVSTDIIPLKDDHIAALNTEKNIVKALRSKNKASEWLPGMLVYKLPLIWNEPMQMPLGVASAQAVVIGGKMYIGGGGTELSTFKIILEYTIGERQFREIESPVMMFGMAVINDQLIIAGGNHSEFNTTDLVWVLNENTNKWAQPFPAMPTAIEWCTAVGYKRWLLVVGGSGERCEQVLDTNSKQWYAANPLPSVAVRPSLTVIQDTLYAAWETTVVSICIPALISDAILQKLDSTEWQSLPDTLTNSPALTSFYGQLLAIGASGTPSSQIAMYLPHMEQWKEVAEMPSPRDACTCVVLPETEELMVIGGYDKFQFIRTIDISCLEQV